MSTPTGIGGSFSEGVESISTMLGTWDFKPAFDYASSYSGVTPDPGNNSVIIVAGGWPWALVEQLEVVKNSLMTVPIMGVVEMPDALNNTYIGDDHGPGTQAGTRRYARRAHMRFLVAVWADQQIGGSDLVRAIGGQIEGCVLYNSNRLSTVRNLKSEPGHAQLERANIWRFDTLVDGWAIVSVDA